QAAPSRQEHDLRRRALPPAEHRPGGDGARAQEADGEEAQGDRAETGCAAHTQDARDPDAMEPLNETAGMILVEGNEAAAFGCMMAGVTVCAWYPITPPPSPPETLITLLKEY